jgi:hypothetical protein
MFWRRAFDEVGGYREACTFWEDRDLFIRMGHQGRILVLPAALYRLRCHPKSIRLSTSPQSLQDAFHLMVRCLAVYRTGRDYTPLLDGGLKGESGGDDAALPWLEFLGSLRLWAGLRPRIIRHLRTLQGLRLNRSSLRVLALATLGELSPQFYRYVLRAVYSLRDWRAGTRIDEWRPVEWRFG